MNTDFSDEDLEEEDTFWTESSGGSSSGIDGNNYNTITHSKSMGMGANIGIGGAGGYFQNQPGRNSTPSSKPIQIGSVSSHSNRSASIALDNDDDQVVCRFSLKLLSKFLSLGSKVGNDFSKVVVNMVRLSCPSLIDGRTDKFHELGFIIFFCFCKCCNTEVCLSGEKTFMNVCVNFRKVFVWGQVTFLETSRMITED